jgi:hypothetical protein
MYNVDRSDMTKKEQKIYGKMIGDIAHGLMMDAYKSSLAVSDVVYRAVLRSLRDCIDDYFANHPEE